MTKLFITGATGYIGGDALYAIAHAHPELEITAIVRSSEKGAKIAAQYPKIHLVYGDLDSTELLTTEAANADIVLHTAHADHPGAAAALVAGLAKRETPGFLIHTSGTGILGSGDFLRKTFGEVSQKLYDDFDNVKEIVEDFPDEAIHRNVDKIVLAAGTQHPGKVFTAIVAPPCINGPGRGPDNQKSIQIYWLAKAVLERKKGFQVGDGKNRWWDVHVQDLSNVFLRLVEEAIKGGGSATWGKEGYYFASNGEFYWGDIAKGVAKAAYDKKLIPTAEVDIVSAEEAESIRKYGSYMWGTNSRGKAIRARKLLGWEPKQKSVLEYLGDIVELEAKGLGIIPGHAAVAAGDA